MLPFLLCIANGGYVGWLLRDLIIVCIFCVFILFYLFFSCQHCHSVSVEGRVFSCQHCIGLSVQLSALPLSLNRVECSVVSTATLCKISVVHALRVWGE